MDVNIAASVGLVVDLGANNDVTVTGTVDLGATDNAVLDAIAASVAAIDADATTIIGHVDGIEGLLGTIDADTGSILTAVQLIDDTVQVLGTDTYTETTSKGITMGAVRRDADTTLVGTTNEFGPLQMDANGRLKVEAFSGEALPVTMTSTTITGTVAVTQSGSWDEVGINDSGNSITVDWAGSAPPIGAGVEATALRVTLATDSTGVVSVDDGGGSLTVDGTVAVTNAGITTIAGAVSGTEMQVDVLTSALPTGAATAAKQPALGTAGTASSDVITVQGIASMTALKVDGSDVTQPVSHAALTELAAAINVSSQMDVNLAASNATVTVDLGVNNDVTVTGTVDLGATDNAVLDAIAASLALLDNAIPSGNELQVDVVGALPAGTNAIGKLAANSGVDIGDVDILSIAAGTNSIGNVGLVPRTSGGMTIFKSIDIDETEEEIKASAGQVFSISAFNHTAAPLYLKFYNATAANVTVGTTAPVLTFTVPGNADSDGAGFVWNNTIGFAFGTAITVACTGAIADNDATAPAANACSVMVGYA